MENGEGRMKVGNLSGIVVAVSLSAVHQFSKPVQESIRLLVGLGVEGDAHLGVTRMVKKLKRPQRWQLSKLPR